MMAGSHRVTCCILYNYEHNRVSIDCKVFALIGWRGVHPNTLLSRRDPLNTETQTLKERKFFVFKFYFFNIQKKQMEVPLLLHSKQTNKQTKQELQL